jgi:hypothetical protein
LLLVSLLASGCRSPVAEGSPWFVRRPAWPWVAQDAADTPAEPAVTAPPAAARGRLPSPTPPPTAERPEPRDVHLWVWDGNVAYDLDAERRFFALLDTLPVAGVFLAFTPAEREVFLVRHPEIARQFLSRCHARGVRVHFLLSENTWVYPARRSGFHRARNELARFQAEGPPVERFDALHLDVEPHALPEWDDPEIRPTLAAGLVELLAEARLPGLGLVADVPFWYDAVDHGDGSLLEAVLARTDGVAVMDYRTDPQAFLEGVAAEQQRAAALGKSLLAGVSVEPTLPDRAAWRSWPALRSFFGRMRPRLVERGRFDGFSIQGYREFLALSGLE